MTRVLSCTNLSAASNSGSGLSTIPGPPPNGLSSTVLCRSCVQSRKLCITNSSSPALLARWTMLTSKGPANISGKSVSTSTFMLHLWHDSLLPGRLLFDDFDGATLAFARAPGEEQGTNRVNRHALTTDDAAHIAGIHTQFVNGHTGAINRRDGDLVGIFDQTFHHVFQKGLHN